MGQHVWEDGAHQLERGGQVDGHDALILGVGVGCGGGEGVHYAGVVYEDVDFWAGLC